MIRILTLFVLTTALAVIAFAAAADGVWSVDGSDPSAPRQLTLQVNGSALTGNLDGIGIFRGGVDGTYLWFRVTRQGTTFQYKGQIVNGKIKLHESSALSSRDLTLSKLQ